MHTDGDPVPQFELTCRYDDDVSPAEVTLFCADCGDDPTTAWLTADVGLAVSLADAR